MALLQPEDIASNFWNRFWAEATVMHPLGERTSELVEQMPYCTPKADCILEVGVGDGRNLSRLAGLGDRIVGVDISPKAMERIASLKGKVEAELHAVSGYALPLPSESCDIVVATDLMNHLDNPAKLCSEIWRVLKKGGRFVGNAMSTRDPSRPAAALKGETISGEQFSIAWNGVADEEPVSMTMRYYGDTELKRLFRDFRWTEPPVEYVREDLGHPPPFDPQPHQHVFWKILVQKP
jgi:SAM-dependent methyltransferase